LQTGKTGETKAAKESPHSRPNRKTGKTMAAIGLETGFFCAGHHP
jgi:hypothetical protein